MQKIDFQYLAKKVVVDFNGGVNKERKINHSIVKKNVIETEKVRI